MKAGFGLGKSLKVLAFAVAAYALLALLSPELFSAALNQFVSLLSKTLPLFVFIIPLMLAVNLLVEGERLKKALNKYRGKRGWAVAVAAGIFSIGPAYLWFQVLSDLKQKGMRPAFVTAFLYARSIKLPLLPFMVYYFGVAYTLALNLLLLAAAIASGWLTERVLGKGQARF